MINTPSKSKSTFYPERNLNLHRPSVFLVIVERAQNPSCRQADSHTSIASWGQRPVMAEGSPSPKGSTEGIRDNRSSPMFATSVGGNSAWKLVPWNIDLGSLSASLRRIYSTSWNVPLRFTFSKSPKTCLNIGIK